MVSFNDVELLSVSLRRVAADLPYIDDLSTAISFSWSWTVESLGVREGVQPKGTMVGLEYSFSLGTESDPSLVFSATYDVKYVTTTDVQLSAADWEHFGANPGAVIVHPYVRELLQGLTVRASLPPLTLPLLRVRSQDWSQVDAATE